MTVRPLRVVADGFALSDGSQLRGIGTVLEHILEGLGPDPRFDVTALVLPDARLPEGTSKATITRHNLRPRLADIEHEMLLPHDLRKLQTDVVWSPGTHPPRRVHAPLVQTIHDLTPLYWPDPTLAHEARRWRRSARRIRDAACVVADSRSSADQAIEFLDVSPSRVEVVPLGVDPRFRPRDHAQPDPPYVLYVGAWGPHKGMAEALAVVDALAELGYPHRLSMAGPGDAWMRARVAAHVAACQHPDRVDLRFWVDDLVPLYQGASALAFTSRAEGFGLPIVEAMACGTPVVAFANTSIPEVAGDAAVLVNDGDVAALVAAVRDVLDNDARAAELRAAGQARAAAFGWDKTVDAYADIFLAAGRRS